MRLLADTPVVGSFHPGRRPLDLVAAHCATARSAGIKAQDVSVVVFDYLHVTAPPRPKEMAPRRLEADLHEQLQRLLPWMLVDVELFVAPREERNQEDVVHLAD